MTTALAILCVLQFFAIIGILYQHGRLVQAHQKLLRDSIELSESYFAFRREFEAYRAKHDPRPVNLTLIKGDKE